MTEVEGLVISVLEGQRADENGSFFNKTSYGAHHLLTLAALSRCVPALDPARTPRLAMQADLQDDLLYAGTSSSLRGTSEVKHANKPITA